MSPYVKTSFQCGVFLKRYFIEKMFGKILFWYWQKKIMYKIDNSVEKNRMILCSVTGFFLLGESTIVNEIFIIFMSSESGHSHTPGVTRWVICFGASCPSRRPGPLVCHSTVDVSYVCAQQMLAGRISELNTQMW